MAGIFQQSADRKHDQARRTQRKMIEPPWNLISEADLTLAEFVLHENLAR